MFTRSYAKSLPAEKPAASGTMRSSCSTALESPLRTLLLRLPFMKEHSRAASVLISTLLLEVMKWITRENIKVDRVACPWLIQHFIDPAAEFIFLSPDTDWPKIDEGIVFDVPNCELGH